MRPVERLQVYFLNPDSRLLLGIIGRHHHIFIHWR